MKRIYMDNAATTRVRAEALEAMLPALSEAYGNPSSVHAFGREARGALDGARAEIAEAIGARADEVFFTSGGSEADNWALRSAVAAGRKSGKTHIITTQIEHHAILHACAALEKEGCRVTYLPVDGDGLVTAEQVANAICPDTAIVSVMMANNEIGTIEPVADIARVCRARGVAMHTDAVQAAGHIPVDVRALEVDYLSLSGHKFYGPKGVGVLYARKGARLSPLIAGGAQERGLRAGTENVAGALGMARALTLAVREMPEEAPRMRALRDRLIDGVCARIADTRVNGSRAARLPGNASFCFKYIEGESLLLSLDLKGIAGSSGSACTSGSLDPSHVLLAIGLPHEIAHGSLRLSLGKDNTEEEVEETIEALVEIVARLRNMSPLYQEEANKNV